MQHTDEIKPLTDIQPPAPRREDETPEAYAARVQAHYGTERAPSPIKSLAQINRLREVAGNADAKYTRARYDSDMAVTDLAALPERLHPKTSREDKE